MKWDMFIFLWIRMMLCLFYMMYTAECGLHILCVLHLPIQALAGRTFCEFMHIEYIKLGYVILIGVIFYSQFTLQMIPGIWKSTFSMLNHKLHLVVTHLIYKMQGRGQKLLFQLKFHWKELLHCASEPMVGIRKSVWKKQQIISTYLKLLYVDSRIT